MLVIFADEFGTPSKAISATPPFRAVSGNAARMRTTFLSTTSSPFAVCPFRRTVTGASSCFVSVSSTTADDSARTSFGSASGNAPDFASAYGNRGR